MALVRPSTPGNPGCHYIYEVVDGLMIDDVFYASATLRSLVRRSLLTKMTLPWSSYVNGKVAKWVIKQIDC